MARLAVALILIGALGLLLQGPDQPARAQPAKGGYAPVATPAALNRAVQSSLRGMQEWIDQRDYVSAGESLRELATLLPLYANLGSSADWKTRHAALKEAVNQLGNTVRTRNPAEIKKAIDRCGDALASLTKADPGTPDATGYRPTGGIKTWMVLLDSAYNEAKSAKNAADFDLSAQALAEESNAVALLRGDGRWQQTANEVRDLALGSITKAKADGLDTARAELKKLYQRCEACHQGNKR
jgi:hypothetical protein